MAGKEILLIEDNVILADALESVLQIEGYHVNTAVNGHKALEICHHELPDIVVSDVMMDEMGGFGFLQQLRELPGGSDLPVVVMTGKSGNAVAENAKAHNVVALLEKPFEIKVFLSTVGEALMG